MAVVIDVNCSHKVILDVDYEELRKWFTYKKGKVAVCISLLKELGTGEFVPFLVEMERNKQIRFLNGNEESQMSGVIEKILPRIKSDDEHILAMMIIGGFRLIVTKDKNLIKDVKDKSIIDNPRGAIYTEGTAKKRIDSADKLLRKLGPLGDK